MPLLAPRTFARRCHGLKLAVRRSSRVETQHCLGSCFGGGNTWSGRRTPHSQNKLWSYYCQQYSYMRSSNQVGSTQQVRWSIKVICTAQCDQRQNGVGKPGRRRDDYLPSNSEVLNLNRSSWRRHVTDGDDIYVVVYFVEIHASLRQ